MTEHESNRDGSGPNLVKKESGRPGRKKQVKKNQEETDNVDNTENIDEEVVIKNSNQSVVENGQEKDQLTIPNYDIIEQLISPIR